MRKKIIILCGLVLILGVSAYCFFDSSSKDDNLKKEVKEEKIVLSEYVMTTDEVKLYSLDNDKFVEIGLIGSNELIHIGNEKDSYYKVDNLDGDYYINGEKVVNSEVVNNEDSNDRYKSYIVFNKNVVTSNETSLYAEDGKLVYKFNKEMNFPIIINDSDKYGVEFEGRLLYIKNDMVEVVDSNNTDLENTKGIGVLNYHFFYDESIPEKRAECNQIICASKSQFKMHLDYIRDNNFLTLTMDELEMYIDGKIRLPKSVVITIDDGWLVELGIQMLTEYQFNATLFLVTGWYDPDSFRNEYIELHSHSHNMHNAGDCPVGQGGGIQCLDREVILNDLIVSSEELGGSKVFCYPFYEFNDYSISMLKEAGYKMAFAGESYGSNSLVKVGSNKYKLPRFAVVSYTTMNDFTNFLNGYY